MTSSEVTRIVKGWLTDIPVLSHILFRKCRKGDSSEVYAVWRWKRCG